MGTVENITALRIASLAGFGEYRLDSPEALSAIRDAIAADLDATDAVRLLDDGKRAAVLLLHRPAPCFEQAQRCRVELAIGDAAAAAWVVEQLRSLAPRYEDTLELALVTPHTGLHAPLEEIGLRPRLRHLHGCPRIALQGLRDGGINRDALGDTLRIETLSSEAQIAAILAMMAKFFHDNPANGFFGPRVALTAALQARIDSFVGALLHKALEDATAFVVLRDDTVVGYGSSHPRHDPVLGKVGGMALGFSEEIHGRGISKLVYEKLLERLVELDVDQMKGRSANPAVIHLAGRMQRPTRAWQLEPSKPC